MPEGKPRTSGLAVSYPLPGLPRATSWACHKSSLPDRSHHSGQAWIQSTVPALWNWWAALCLDLGAMDAPRPAKPWIARTWVSGAVGAVRVADEYETNVLSGRSLVHPHMSYMKDCSEHCVSWQTSCRWDQSKHSIPEPQEPGGTATHGLSQKSIKWKDQSQSTSENSKFYSEHQWVASLWDLSAIILHIKFRALLVSLSQHYKEICILYKLCTKFSFLPRHTTFSPKFICTVNSHKNHRVLWIKVKKNLLTSNLNLIAVIWCPLCGIPVLPAQNQSLLELLGCFLTCFFSSAGLLKQMSSTGILIKGWKRQMNVAWYISGPDRGTGLPLVIFIISADQENLNRKISH